MEKIRRCPFCGSEAKLYTTANGVAVSCTNRYDCGCRTKWYMDVDVNKWIRGNKVSIEKAIEAWNRRADND